MPKKKNTIGIIGGMGPAATVDLMQRIIDNTPADDDCDHLHLLVDNNPNIPSRIAALIDKTGLSPAPVMMEMALGLQKQGADVLAIPCNTAHFYHKEVAKAVSIPILNMIDLSANHIKTTYPSYKKVGLLASTALLITKLYEPYCEKHGLELVYPAPEDQDKVMNLIKAVKSNQHQPQHVEDYLAVTNNLRVQGADCLLVACTELSVIGFERAPALPHLDALDILVKEIVRIGLNN